MKIDVSESEYRDLLTLLFLGNDIVNARFTDEDRPAGYQRYTELYKKISALCTETEMKYEFDHDLESGNCYPNAEYEAELCGMIDDYDDETFWESLTDNLAMRDAARELNVTHPPTMEADKDQRYLWLKTVHKYTALYTKEFEENGVERITIPELLLKIQNDKKQLH